MTDRVERMWCDDCQDWQAAVSPGPNHILHLLLTLVTGGIWIIVWIFAGLVSDFRCRECGSGAVSPRSRYNREVRRREKRARGGKRSSRSLDPESDRAIPPKPSVLREDEHAKWMAKYGRNR